MTPDQKKHAETIAMAFTGLMKDKYKKGVEEHGGNIWDMSALHLIEEAISENIDQFVYLYTARQKLLGQK